MKIRSNKREYVVVLVAVALFAFAGIFCLSTLSRLGEATRVISALGTVRSAGQRLAKEELMGYPDNQLLRLLDTTVEELAAGQAPLPDEYLACIAEVESTWAEMRGEIERVRAGEDDTSLYRLSEDFYTLTDNAAAAAESYGAGQLYACTRALTAFLVLLLLLLAAALLYVVRRRRKRRGGDVVRQPAYVDRLTGIANRTGCEKYIERYQARPLIGKTGVFMFDMNNLKAVNDALGHKGGDEIIRTFASILEAESRNYGFVGRWGGDEFIVILEDTGAESAEDFLASVNERVIANNLLRLTEMERISFAAGYVAESLEKQSLGDMIDEADRKMFERKRQMRENRD